MTTGVLLLELEKAETLPDSFIQVEDTSDLLNALASMESIHNQLIDMANTGQKQTQLGFSMVRQAVNKYGGLTLSTESDNYFEYTNVNASMEGVVSTVWRIIKEFFMKLFKIVQGIYSWIKKIFFKAKAKLKTFDKVKEGVKKMTFGSTNDRYSIPVTALANMVGGDVSLTTLNETVKAYTNAINVITNKQIIDTLTYGINTISKSLSINTKQIKDLAKAAHESGMITSQNAVGAFKFGKQTIKTLSVGQIGNALSAGVKAIASTVGSDVNEDSAKEAIESCMFAIEALYTTGKMSSSDYLARINIQKLGDNTPYLTIDQGKATNCINDEKNADMIKPFTDNVANLYTVVVKYYDDWNKRDDLYKTLEKVIASKFDIDNASVNTHVTTRFTNLLKTHIQSEYTLAKHAEAITTESFDLIKQIAKYHLQAS